MRSALRTLTVLRALNIHNGATVGELALVTGISRPALYRILETLREAGYICVDIAGKHYCLTMLVRTLAEGFSDEDWVTQIARPALARLQRKIVWPTDLGTFRSNGMWIRETTRRLSPLTIDRAVAGTRFCMLGSATGRAYLAFCRADEREQILCNLRLAVEPGNELILRPGRLEAILEDVRKKGYGYRYGEPPKESGAIAVPILAGERIFGCVNMTFMAATLTPEEAARKHLTDLREAADTIANGTRQLETAASSSVPGKVR
ncbi:MAG TPA: IclR family transcriptional regulator C-terminal domain-containing protein [Steroidobacteraceae bacterium]|nr:IclR family transcriptional regulator C-terminal domain-containing protein [Steroidobacteraceae bacterium]